MDLSALGRWPVPRLRKPATLVGLTTTQWAYAFVCYGLWSWAGDGIVALGAVMARPAPWPAGDIAWVAPAPLVPAWITWLWWAVTALALLLGVVCVFWRWHARHAVQIAWLWLSAATEAPLSVWRPVAPGWDTPDEDDQEEEDDEDDAAAADEALPTPANPRGWDTGGIALADLEAPAVRRAGA